MLKSNTILAFWSQICHKFSGLRGDNTDLLLYRFGQSAAEYRVFVLWSVSIYKQLSCMKEQ